MAKQDKTYRVGKHTGYELRNGEYHLAPMYVEQFDRITNRRNGIQMMLEAVTEHAALDYQAVSVAQRKLWDAIGEDFGVNFGKGQWTYLDGVIRPMPEPTEKRAAVVSEAGERKD